MYAPLHELSQISKSAGEASRASPALFHRLSPSQCRDPIYRVRDSSKDTSDKAKMNSLTGDKSSDPIYRVPTLDAFFSSMNTEAVLLFMFAG
jgi:hypothetical protein